MFAKYLIGKQAIRKGPTKAGDYSYNSNPVTILNATKDHIVIDYQLFPSDKYTRTHVLDNRWCDNNWADYNEIMAPALRLKEELRCKLDEITEG